jgi:hypothetical protein
MNVSGPIDRLLRTNNILEYQGDVIEDAKRARKDLDTFNRVNQIISTPEKNDRIVSESLRSAYQAHKDILSGAIERSIEKKLGIDKVV